MTRTLRERLAARDAGPTVRHVRTPADDTRQNAQNRAGRAEGLEMGQHTLTRTREPQAIVANATAPAVGTLVRVTYPWSPFVGMTGVVEHVAGGFVTVRMSAWGTTRVLPAGDVTVVERGE